jgi:hypothetical protein
MEINRGPALLPPVWLKPSSSASPHLTQRLRSLRDAMPSPSYLQIKGLDRDGAGATRRLGLVVPAFVTVPPLASPLTAHFSITRVVAHVPYPDHASED